MRLKQWWDTDFVVELILLALAAPILYFPARFPPALLSIAFVFLLGTWLWRRWRLGYWYAKTPVDWPIFFLFLVMLPVSIWAAPEPLRDQYSWPKAYVLVWNFFLFYTITTHARRHTRLFYLSVGGFIVSGMVIALLAPLGANWLHKLPGSQAILSQLPSVMADLSREGPSGFHPNMIAGGLLYVLPFLISLMWALYRARRTTWFWLTLACTFYMGLVFGLLQSRGGIMGLAVALVAMPLLHYRWGRWALLGGTATVALVTPFVFTDLIRLIGDTPSAAALGGTATLENFRMNLWQQALLAIQDFPFTGSGLGAFQEIAHLLYPLEIPPSYYFGHAHNYWLQAAIDFGVPGLLAIAALWAAGAVQAYRAWRQLAPGVERGIALGMLGALVASLFHGLTDALSMGSTPNLLFWYLFALIFGLGNLYFRAPKGPEREAPLHTTVPAPPRP